MFLILSLHFNLAEMIKNKNIDRYIVVVVGFCVVATSGFVGGFWQQKTIWKITWRYNKKEVR